MDASKSPQVRALVEHGGDAFRTTRLEAIANWARKSSVAVYPFAGACCGPEVSAAAGPRYDLSRFGFSLPTYAPAHSDLLLVSGTLTRRLVPILEQAYTQMAEPKWVMALGACACSGGPYQNYATVPGADSVVPVDLYVPGCPPRPEAILDGVLKLQGRMQAERVPARGRHRGPGDFPASVARPPS